MRLAPLALAALVALTPAVRADGEDPPAERLPLLPIAASWLHHDAAGTLPMGSLRVVAGRLPEGVAGDWSANQASAALGHFAAWPDLFAGEGLRVDLARDLASGTLALRPCVVGEPVAIVIVGPAVNSGEAWGPAELRRRGRTVTVLVESWTDNTSRRRNVPRRDAYVVPLGLFPQDGLEIVVEQRTLFMDVEHKACHYAVRTAPPAVKLEVPAAAAPELTCICRGEDDPKAVAIDQLPRSYQRPASTEAVPGVVVDHYDLVRWLGPAGGAAEAPVAGAQQGLVARIVGPVLQSYEGQSLRRVTWEGARVRIALEVWGDHGRRYKNIPWRPVMLVPLVPPPALAEAEFEVTVEWTVWFADTTGGPSAADPGARQKVIEEAKWSVAWKPQ